MELWYYREVMTERFVNNSIFSQLFYSGQETGLSHIGDYPVLIIFWNLFLLVVPFLMVTLLQRYFPSSGQRKSILHWIFFGMAGVIWLMFIPNSAYIITEIRHLLDYCPVNSLRDVCVSGVWLIMFYFLYSVVGWVSFVLLLDQMKNFLRRAFNTELSRIFVLVVIPIISLGVLLGLINRFNSWEIFIQPLIILDVMLTYFTDLIYLANWIVFTLGLYILYLGGDILFKKRGAKTNNFSIQKEDANSGE